MEYQEVLQKYISEKKHFDAYTKSSIFPILLDQILRWFTFILLSKSLISFTNFTILQILIVPILLGIFCYYRFKYIKRKISLDLNLRLYSLIPTAIQGILLFTFIILGWVLINDIINKYISLSILMSYFLKILLIIFSTIYLIVLSFLFSPSMKIRDIYFYPEYTKSYYCLQLDTLRNVNNNEVQKRQNAEVIDKNDIEITNLESEIVSITNRSETFILESIFIGALTFSGFLTLISSDKIQENIGVFKTILDDISNIITSVYSLDLAYFDTITKNSNYIYKIFAIIAVLTLICSLFFLTVLATRIRLSELIDNVKHLLNLAKLYNAKEEELYLLELQKIENIKKRQDHLKLKIDKTLDDANKAINNLRPLLNFMSIFRALGIYTFYIILIISGLYFSTSIIYSLMGIILLAIIIRYIIGLGNINHSDRIIKIYKNK